LRRKNDRDRVPVLDSRGEQAYSFTSTAESWEVGDDGTTGPAARIVEVIIVDARLTIEAARHG
jgi:S-adenosylmethionine synthetase